MTDDSQTLERDVAEFVVGFGSNDIDDKARAVAKALLKDQLAIQVGASQLPWSRQVRAFLRKPRGGSATAVGESACIDAADAAYLNASYGHGFEYDDVAGNAHPGCCVVPVAIAVGEEVGATLEQVLVAMVAGYEVYARIGRIGAPDLLNNGWQPHSVLANFGAAAVAAKLHGFDVERTHHALAIAMSHCSGTTEYTSTGGSIKRVHAGIGARNGIESAALARAGITGPRRWLTGNKGFYRTFIRKAIGHDARAEFAPGQPLQLKNEHCYAPRNIEELQYALPVQMALSLLGKGNGYATHRAFLRGDLKLDAGSEVIALARKIELRVSPELDQRYRRNFVADVTVRYTDGSSQHVFLDRAKGMPGNPFTPEEHRAKLNELTVEVIGAQRADRLFELIDRLESARPVGDLTALLRPPTQETP